MLPLLATCFIANVQSKEYRYKLFTIDQGLSQNSVNCMLQDRMGFMWFGTQEGLNRYDGYEFRQYKYDFRDPNSLGNNYVQSLVQDSSGRIWIGTQGGGLNLYEPSLDRFTRYRHRRDETNTPGNNLINALIIDNDQVIWIGTFGTGLDRFDPGTDQFEHFTHDPNNPSTLSDNHVTALAMDQSGFIWIGTSNGLNRLDPVHRRIARVYSKTGNPEPLPDNRITALLIDEAGTLWVGTENGLAYRKKGEIAFHTVRIRFPDGQNLSSLRITALRAGIDPGRTVWVGVLGQGLIHFDGSSGQWFQMRNDPSDPQSLSDNEVQAILPDRSGGLWVGTRNGLNRIDHSAKLFITHRHEPNNSNSLCHNTVWALQKDHRGRIWIGTSGGLSVYNREKNRYRHYFSGSAEGGDLSHQRIYCLLEDRKKRLWVGTGRGGLNLYDPETDGFSQFRHDPDNANSLSDDGIYFIRQDPVRNGLWVGTRNGGLNYFDPDKGTFLHFRHSPDDPSSLSGDRTYTAYFDREGVLWVGCWGAGLNRLDFDSKTFTRFTSSPEDESTILDNNILCIHESVRDTVRRLWIGTPNGLSVMDVASETFTHYREEDGLPNNVIYGILEDEKGWLWMSTNRGLCRLNPKTMRFKNYDVSDGIQSNEFNTGAFYRSSSGEMFFGGVAGFTRFFPEKIVDNPIVPPVQITDFRIFNQTVPIGEWENTILLKKSILETETIRLPHRFTMFTLGFSALHYVSPEKNEYAYYLEGLEKDWNYVGSRRFVTYTNLPARKYRFRVKASNNDGIWNETGTSLTIMVLPPFYNTWWFRSIGILMLTGFIFSGHLLRVRSIHRKKKELEEINLQLNQEVRQRKETEAQVLRERNLLRTIIDNIPDKIYFKDRNSRFILVNTAQARWMGYSKSDDLEGKSDYDFYPKASADRFFKAEQALMESGQSLINRIEEQPASDGKIMWIASTSKLPMKDDKGKIIGLVGVSRDITTLIKAEKVLKESRQRLEKRVRERTRVLHQTNEELKQEISERKRIEEEREKLILELKEALKNVKRLRGMLPICASCKKVRDDHGYWQQVEEYIRNHSDVEFSHGLCPDCLKAIYPEYAEEDTKEEKE